MLTSRHWGYHISADLSYPKFVCFLWAVRHGDHTCDRAAPPRPGEAWRNERLGKWETSLRPHTWLYCGTSDSPPHKRQWDETDSVWRFVFRVQFTGGASASLGYLNHFKKGWLSWSGVDAVSAGRITFRWWEVWNRHGTVAGWMLQHLTNHKLYVLSRIKVRTKDVGFAYVI